MGVIVYADDQDLCALLAVVGAPCPVAMTLNSMKPLLQDQVHDAPCKYTITIMLSRPLENTPFLLNM